MLAVTILADAPINEPFHPWMAQMIPGMRIPILFEDQVLIIACVGKFLVTIHPIHPGVMDH